MGQGVERKVIRCDPTDDEMIPKASQSNAEPEDGQEAGK